MIRQNPAETEHSRVPFELMTVQWRGVEGCLPRRIKHVVAACHQMLLGDSESRPVNIGMLR